MCQAATHKAAIEEKKYESGGKKCQSKRAINASDLMQPGENKDCVTL